VFARTWARAAVARTVPPHLERACYAWASSLLFIGVCRLWQPVPGVAYQLAGAWWWLGMAAQAAGMAITCLASVAVDPLDLAGIRQLRAAHGAPAQASLKTTGMYGLVRHPIYFGWALLVFGAPTMTGTRLSFALVSTAYLAIAIPFEERGLVGTFGQQYDEYRERVRWRMIPGVY
jgi:protein-S-isoprenylcysteine O-methyltransferase Ste14